MRLKRTKREGSVQLSPLNYDTVTRKLEEFKGCQFTGMSERQRIEDLVQGYLESPQVHTLDFNRQLLYHLINAEYAPFQVVARSGLQPTGFWVSTFPRVGAWIVYAGLTVIWVASVSAVLSSHRSTLQSLVAWVWIALLAALTAYHLRRFLRFRLLNVDLQSLFEREIQPGNFDPSTLSQRLHRLEEKYGLKLHSNVFALLRLQKRLLNPPMSMEE